MEARAIIGLFLMLLGFAAVESPGFTKVIMVAVGFLGLYLIYSASKMEERRHSRRRR